MRVQSKAMDSYGVGNMASQASVANSTELIQMLFDGLVAALVAAQGHLEHGAIQEKGRCIARASGIVLGLQGSLDFENGGDLAKNLDDLYAYVTRRLIFANSYNDLSVLKELYGLMSELRNAWQQVPVLMRSRQAPAFNGQQLLTAQV